MAFGSQSRFSVPAQVWRRCALGAADVSGFSLRADPASILRVTLVSLAFCFAVEFSQLYHAPGIDSVRNTRLGALTIGSTFNAPDLIAYAAAIALGVVIETLRQRRPQ